MIDVSDYWTLPPLGQRMTRTEVAHFERDLQRVVGYYAIWLELHGGVIEFTLLCDKCYSLNNHKLLSEYDPLTKEQYLDKNHDMHGETCEKCKKSLV